MDRLIDNKTAADQEIDDSLYTLEIKLQTGQQRAKNWHDENIKGKAYKHNKRVEEIKEVHTSVSGSQSEAIELERLNKLVAKTQKMQEFSKIKEDEAAYISQHRGERAQAIQQRVEQAKRQQRKQNLHLKKRQESKDGVIQNRHATLKE